MTGDNLALTIPLFPSTKSEDSSFDYTTWFSFQPNIPEYTEAKTISLRLSSIHQPKHHSLRSVIMNFFVPFSSPSILSLTTLILFLTGLTAHAQTPTTTITGTENSNLQPQSDSASEIAQTTIQIEPGRATRSGSSYLGLAGKARSRRQYQCRRRCFGSH